MVSFSKTEKELTALVANGQGTGKEVGVMADITQSAKKVFPEANSALAQDGDTVAAVLSLMNRVRPAELVVQAKTNQLFELRPCRIRLKDAAGGRGGDSECLRGLI